MWRILVALCISINGYSQTNTVKTYLSWFERTELDSVFASFKPGDYNLIEQKDSLNFHSRSFSRQSELGIPAKITISGNDTAVTLMLWENYGHTEQRNISAQLRALRFKQMDARLDGNYITTTFDNGIYIVEQRYQAVDHPENEGQIPLFQHRLFRKLGPYDQLNGQKQLFAKDKQGNSYLAYSETYQNGVLNGPRVGYFPSGKIRLEENYSNGRLAGKQKEYNENGTLIHTATYSYNWHYGPEQWFNNSGEVVRSVNWQRDIKTGQEIEKKDGKVVRLITYKNGIPHGKALLPIYGIQQDSLNDFPELLEELTYINGQKSGKFFRYIAATKDTFVSGSYLKNQYNGILRIYAQKKLQYLITYKEGKRHGDDLTFSNSLSNPVLLKRYFNDDKQDSLEILFVTQGEHLGDTAKIVTYKQGKKIGQELGFFFPTYSNSGDVDWIPYTLLSNYDSTGQNGFFQVNFPDSLHISGQFKNNFRDSIWSTTKYEKEKLTTIKMTYQMGQLNGPFEKKINESYNEIGQYLRDKKEGTWTISGDSTWTKRQSHESYKRIENYKNNQLFGLRQIYQNDILIQQDSMVSNTVISCLKPNPSGFIHYTLDSINNGSGYAYVSVSERKMDTLLYYTLGLIMDNSLQQNYLRDWVSWLENNPTEIIGNVRMETKDFICLLDNSFSLKNASLINYTIPPITQERITNQGVLIYYFENNEKAFSGTFYSSFEHCDYVIKNGYLNGWVIYYDNHKSPIKRVKYKKGLLKKQMNLR